MSEGNDLKRNWDYFDESSFEDIENIEMIVGVKRLVVTWFHVMTTSYI